MFNGSSWQTIWQSTSAVQDSSWQRQQFDISAYKNANMRVRFGFNVGAAGAQFERVHRASERVSKATAFAALALAVFVLRSRGRAESDDAPNE